MFLISDVFSYTLINRLYREALANGTLDLVGDLDTLLQEDDVSTGTPLEEISLTSQSTKCSHHLDWFLSLSTPHKCYLDEIKMLSGQLRIKGLAHITGGGLIDNPPRILPDGLAFRFDRKAIDGNMSNDFKLLWKMSQFKTHLEMYGLWSSVLSLNAFKRYKTFNSGIGMIVVLDHSDVDSALLTLPGTFILGQVVKKSNAQVEFF